MTRRNIHIYYKKGATRYYEPFKKERQNVNILYHLWFLDTIFGKVQNVQKRCEKRLTQGARQRQNGVDL